MASLQEHENDCYAALGNPFTEVHRWLDEFFRTMGPKHRAIRHHQGGVDEARKKWGDDAAQAAEIHIHKDWDWHPDYRGKIPLKWEAEIWSDNLL